MMGPSFVKALNITPPILESTFCSYIAQTVYTHLDIVRMGKDLLHKALNITPPILESTFCSYIAQTVLILTL